MINARAESLGNRAAFSESFRGRRCLVLADGYYEWAAAGREKVPYFFHLAGHSSFAMAGLWDRWDSGEGFVESCTIITTDASSRTSRYHPRMPVLFTLESAGAWLDPATSAADLNNLLRPYEGDDLECYEVSRLVNAPANDSPECITQVGLLL